MPTQEVNADIDSLQITGMYPNLSAETVEFVLKFLVY